jgi:hypothetical protein
MAPEGALQARAVFMTDDSVHQERCENRRPVRMRPDGWDSTARRPARPRPAALQRLPGQGRPGRLATAHEGLLLVQTIDRAQRNLELCRVAPATAGVAW